MSKYIHYFCSRKINCCCHLIGTSSVATGFLTVILPFSAWCIFSYDTFLETFFLWPYVLVISKKWKKYLSRPTSGSNTFWAIWALPQPLYLLCRATAPQGPAVPPGDGKPESSEDTWAACQSRVKLRDALFRFFTTFISLSKILPYSPNDMGSLLLPQQSNQKFSDASWSIASQASLNGFGQLGERD